MSLTVEAARGTRGAAAAIEGNAALAVTTRARVCTRAERTRVACGDIPDVTRARVDAACASASHGTVLKRRTIAIAIVVIAGVERGLCWECRHSARGVLPAVVVVGARLCLDGAFAGELHAGPAHAPGRR